MESESGVPVEVEKIVVAEEENVDVKKENISEEGHDNETGKNKADETPTELSENVPKSKASNQRKVSIGGTIKSNKTAKDQASVQGSSALTRSKKGRMSKSLSFPARGGGSDLTRKSIDVHTKKSDVKPWIPNGVTHEPSHSNGTVSSASRLNPATKGATGGGITTRRTTVGSVPSLRQSLVI